MRPALSEHIGWIGLGKLGYPMAVNLLESGYHLTVYNRTQGKAEPLAERGARVASDPSQVAEKGRIVVSVLWDSDTTESLVTPAFLARMEEGIHIGMCTGSPEGAKRLCTLRYGRTARNSHRDQTTRELPHHLGYPLPGGGSCHCGECGC